jgi:hypothetical protein
MFFDVSEVLAASIIRAMMEAAGNSEMLVYFYQTTQCNILEDSHLYIRYWSSNERLAIEADSAAVCLHPLVGFTWEKQCRRKLCCVRSDV